MPFESVADVDLGSMLFESDIPIDGLAFKIDSPENGSSILSLLACIP